MSGESNIDILNLKRNSEPTQPNGGNSAEISRRRFLKGVVAGAGAAITGDGLLGIAKDKLSERMEKKEEIERRINEIKKSLPAESLPSDCPPQDDGTVDQIKRDPGYKSAIIHINEQAAQNINTDKKKGIVGTAIALGAGIAQKISNRRSLGKK